MEIINTKELLKQKEKLEEMRRLLEIRENLGKKIEFPDSKPKIYRIGRKLEIIDTKESRIEEKIHDICSHPMIWIINCNKSNRDYKGEDCYWYKCLHCGKEFTNGKKPNGNIITAPEDIKYVYYFRKNYFIKFQNEYFNILSEFDEIDVKTLNDILEKRFSNSKIKKK